VWRRAPGQASTRILAAALATAIVPAVGAGCERSAEASRALVAARQASWTRQLARIKAEHVGLKERFGREITSPVGTTNPSALRARATLDGLGQSIADVEIQMRQVGGRVEAAIARGGDEAEKALDDESARMNGHLQALVADLAAVSRQMNGFGNGDRTSKGNE